MKKKLIVFLCLILALTGVFALTGCKKAKETITDIVREAPQNLAYDGQYLTWTKSEGAKHYTVTIDGGEAIRSNSTTYAYETADAFEVTVSAIFDGGEKSTSITFKPLSQITTVTVDNNGAFSWETVSGATAYLLSINGAQKIVTDTRYDELAPGSNRVKVKPVVEGDSSFYSWWSEEKSVYIQSAPTNVKYANGELTWLGNASDYLVSINGTSQEVRGNKLAYSSENKDFTIQITALGNYTTSFNSKMTEETFKYLAPITELVVEDGILKWNAVTGAEGYQIKVDGIVQRNTVTAPEFDKLVSGASKEVAVMPYNNSGNYFSSWSAEKSVYLLDTPVVTWHNELELDGEAENNITWNGVNAAGGYTVRLKKNGTVVDEYTYSDATRAYANAYLDVAIYTVEIKSNAPAANADYYDSKYSAPITIERLAAPKQASESFIVSNKDSLANGFTVNFLQVTNAKSYQLIKDGTPLSGKTTTGSSITDSNVADAQNLQEQNYTYKVRSMGGEKTVDGLKYVTLPCLTSEALSFNITVQATPQNLFMSGFNLTWDGISGSNGYTVSYGGNSYTAETENRDLSTLKAGNYDITVCARGNGAAVLASAYSTPVEVCRLAAPTGIKITSAENGTLMWDSVSNASGYKAFLGGSEVPLDSASFDQMYQFIDTNGTTLSMTAEANEYNDQQTVYYMTSESSPTQQFIRLAAPTFPEGALANSTELVWNAPLNINTQEYTPTYDVFNGNEKITGGSQNGTKFNIEYLSGGQQYSFYVKAIGNDTKYLDSDLSQVRTAWKLETPTLRIENNQYVWSGVGNASGYSIEIDGIKVSDEYHVSGSEYSYTPRFTTVTTHTVVLKAKGDGINNIDSSACIHYQKTEQLSRPTIGYSYSAERFTSGGFITVTVTSPVANALSYQYEVAGATVTQSTTSYNRPIDTTGIHSIRVKALGGKFSDHSNIADKIYYVDSLYTDEGTINILGSPSTPFTINSDGIIMWKAVSGANGYDYQISYNGGAYGEINRTNQANLTVASHKQYTSIWIKVSARGNGDTVVGSDFVEWKWTNS